ncbi:MAG: VPLPA-CTERM sorting domain-containing protein [Cypionkella sp.]
MALTLAIASALAGAPQAAVLSTANYAASSANFSTTALRKENGYRFGTGNSMSFDLSGLKFRSIVSFVLDVVYKRTADTATELWKGRITGTNRAVTSNVISLKKTNTVRKIQILTLTSGTAFNNVVTDKMFKVTFNDRNPASTFAGPDKFFMKTVATPGAPAILSLSVNYVPAVPLPAGGLLLLTSLGCLGMARRRKV